MSAFPDASAPALLGQPGSASIWTNAFGGALGAIIARNTFTANLARIVA